MIRSLARFTLKISSVLVLWSPVRFLVDRTCEFLCALTGKGGGSSWDSAGQTKALANHLIPREEMVIVDVGANNGAWSLELYNRLQEHAPRFHMFECAPYCFEDLQNCAVGIPDALVNLKAVSDCSGEMKLYLPEMGSGLASPYPRGDTSVVQHQYREIVVPTTTVDSYMREAGLDRIDVLKIDVEGHEMAVLRGAQGAIEQGNVGCVLFEFGSANVNSRTFFRDFWEYFSRSGFSLKRVIPGGRVVDIGQYDDTLEYFRGSSNYIAIRRHSRAVQSVSSKPECREPKLIMTASRAIPIA